MNAKSLLTKTNFLRSHHRGINRNVKSDAYQNHRIVLIVITVKQRRNVSELYLERTS
jgi:hypothetical protein